MNANVRKILFWCLVMVLLLIPVLAACAASPAPAPAPAPTPTPAPAPAPAAPIKLVYTFHAAKAISTAVVDIWWMDEVEKRTNGRVKFDRYFDGTLLKAPDTPPGVGRGLADMALTSPVGYTPELLPLSGFTFMVFLSERIDALPKAFRELLTAEPALRQEWEKNNWKILYSDSFSTYAASRKPVTKAEDLKGVRVSGASRWTGEAMQLLGGTSVVMPQPEVYEAFQRGVIDMDVRGPWDQWVSSKFYEVAPYCLDLGMGNLMILPRYMNLAKWNSLPADIQKIMDDVSRDLEAGAGYEILKKYQDDALDVAAKAGRKLVKMSPEEKAKIRGIVVPALFNKWINEVEAKGQPARRVFDTFMKLVQKYEPTAKWESVFDAYEKKYAK